jgi:ATP-dependent Clp protease ATP-binding subunit ClpX
MNVKNKDEQIMDIESINKEVKKSIIGQDDAIKQILSTIYFNQRLYDSDLPYDKLRNLKQNILLVGSTGVGKTEIIKQIAKQLDIPCVIEDATRYTIEGYKGNSVEDMIKHLYESADYDIELAERSILVIDEIDKKSANEDVSSISSTGVQQSLLKLLEGTNYNISGDHENMLEPFEFDSSYLTIILSGAFSHMDEKKSKEKVVGFTASKNVEEKKTTKEFKNSGIVPELLGRMSKIIQLNKLGEKEFVQILKESEISPLRLTKDFYNSLGVEVIYTDSFINDIADVAKKKDIGARGLKTAFDETIETLEFEVLSGNVKKIIFNRIDDIKVIRTEEQKKKLVIQK